MSAEQKPLIGKFEIPLSGKLSEEEFRAKVTGTGPRATDTGGIGGLPPDTGADVDVDF